MGTATAAADMKNQNPDPKGEKKPVRARQDDKFKIFCGSANPALAQEVCDFLGLPLGQAKLMQFSDGEIYVQILENVRGADVFLMQPTCDPVAHNLMELLLMIDALKRASARRITVVIPYFGYARQDRKDKPRVPIIVQTRRRSAHHRRRRPRTRRRLACAADSRLLQHPGRSPFRFTGAGRITSASSTCRT